MTKNEFRKFALLRGCIVNYSGKLKKFFIHKIFKMDIHKIINQNPCTK